MLGWRPVFFFFFFFFGGVSKRGEGWEPVTEEGGGGGGGGVCGFCGGWDFCVGSAGFCGLMEGRVLSSWDVVYVISSSVLSLRWQEKSNVVSVVHCLFVDILNKLLRVAEIRDVREIRASARKEG